MEQQIREDDKTTAVQLGSLDCSQMSCFPGLDVSRQYLLSVDLPGDVHRMGPEYSGDNVPNVTWTNECSVQMESTNTFDVTRKESSSSLSQGNTICLYCHIIIPEYHIRYTICVHAVPT